MADGDFDFIGTVKYLIGDRKIDNNILPLYIDLTKQSILNYCNISELPSALYFLTCKLCAETIIENSKISNNEVTGQVASITEDGRTVTFANSSTEQYANVINNKISHLVELNRYKKLYRIWVDLILVQ